MSRPSREKKREHQPTATGAATAATPIPVHVPVDGAAASVGGERVHSAPGEEIQQAVLNHLHRLAQAAGRPVLATVTDERIGYVVPLRVSGDGSSAFTAQPLRTAPPEPHAGPARVGEPGHAPSPAPSHAPSPPPAPQGEPGRQRQEPADPGAPDKPRDVSTHVLRKVPEPVRETAPTFPLRAVPEPGQDAVPTPPTFALRALPAPDDAPPPGTAKAPTGVFGPPPAMDTPPPAADTPRPWTDTPSGPATPPAAPAPPTTDAGPTTDAAPLRDAPPAGVEPVAGPAAGAPDPHPHPRPAEASPPPPHPVLGPPAEPEPDPRPTPARGFDAVAEAVLGEDPRSVAGEGGAVLLAEPLAQVNEAVKAGRIEEAATLAERTVAQASGTLGPEHPEVLRLRELTAYIAYLAGDPLRAFGLSLDLARIHRRAGDAEGAYGNVQSAATAWRAVRDPEQGLRLGGDLIGLWTELAAEDGPATDDIEQLESARARMGRLAERARRQTPPPTA
ncbi:tetratricopeptide repeat protein [Streptomyces sp. NPDC003374]